MSMLSIVKGHGSRNDIFVIDGTPNDHFTSSEVARAIGRLCDRQSGLGGDGAYFLADEGGGAARAWFFNPDGSPALLCGNGMRLAGRLLLDRHQASAATVRTGPYTFTVRDAGVSSHGVRQVAVELPPVDFAPAEPIIAGMGKQVVVDRLLDAFHPARTVTAAAVPNSHLVSVVDTYDEDDLVQTGRRVAANPDTFPIGANVSYVLPLGTAEVFIRTYERGAGLTPSCGSGVVASRAVLSRLCLADPDQSVLIRNPGGIAHSRLQETRGQWQPVLEGNATVVYRTQLKATDLLGDGPIGFEGDAALDEITAFSELYSENLAALKAFRVHTSD
jgi:diaminopimelate epimerase